MSDFVKIYSFERGKIVDYSCVSMVRKGYKYDAAISVGVENTDQLIFARGSYENFMQNIQELKSLDFSYVSQGYLYKAISLWGFIPLTENQAGKNFRKALMVFKKPHGFEGQISYEFEGGGIQTRRLASGVNGNFNESLILLHQGKILKVTYTFLSKNETFYLLFDGRELRSLNRFQIMFNKLSLILH
jgi:hypothetical protein